MKQFSDAFKALLRKYKIRLTTIRNGKRVYKSKKVLESALAKKRFSNLDPHGGNHFGDFISAKDTHIEPNLCGIKVHIYYYDTWVAKQLGLLYTPAKSRTMNPPDYGGPHHGVAKIVNQPQSNYSEYIFTDNEIKIGNTVIWDINSRKSPPQEVDDNMLMAAVVSCFYSYTERLKYYITGYIKKDLFVDRGHIRAAFMSKERIVKLVNLIQSEQKYNCIIEYLNNQNLKFTFLNNLLDEIDLYKGSLSTDDKYIIKKHILDEYTAKINNLLPPPPLKIATKSSTSRKLEL